MSYDARILADSISPMGDRLTTILVTLPRIVLAEFNTHRMLSRNSASSRAIPVEKRIAMVEADPFVPEAFGKNQKGMQASETLTGEDDENAQRAWLDAMRDAIHHAKTLAGLGVHKQLANRLLEPFCWHTIVASATEWSNFFALRCHPDAQPEIRKAAEMMRDVMQASEPKALTEVDWHLPLIDSEDYERAIMVAALDPVDVLKKLCAASAGRCARVSYLTHEGRRDLGEDVALCDRLISSGHMSPLEHVARPMTLDEAWDYRMHGSTESFAGNFKGWLQLRKLIPHEADFGARILGNEEG